MTEAVCGTRTVETGVKIGLILPIEAALWGIVVGLVAVVYVRVAPIPKFFLRPGATRTEGNGVKIGSISPIEAALWGIVVGLVVLVCVKRQLNAFAVQEALTILEAVSIVKLFSKIQVTTLAPQIPTQTLLQMLMLNNLVGSKERAAMLLAEIFTLFMDSWWIVSNPSSNVKLSVSRRIMIAVRLTMTISAMVLTLLRPYPEPLTLLL